MKRLIPVLFCIVLLFNSCILRVSSPLRVAFLFRSGDEEYLRSLEEGARLAAMETDVELTVFAQSENQAEQFAACVAEGFDAIVIMPENRSALEPYTAIARQKGVPFVTVDAEIELEGSVSLVTGNSRQACNMLASRIMEQTGGDGRAAIIRRGGADGVAERRSELLAEYFKKQTNITLEPDVIVQAGETAYETIGLLLENNPNIDILVGLDTASVLDAASAIAESGREVRLFGFDCSRAQVNLLENDILLATVVQSPYSMGYLGVQSVNEYIRGGKVKERLYTPVVIITKNNVFAGINQNVVFPME